MSYYDECVKFINLVALPLKKSATQCGLLIMPDYWGYNSGRIRCIADHLAQSCNSYVACIAKNMLLKVASLSVFDNCTQTTNRRCFRGVWASTW